MKLRNTALFLSLAVASVASAGVNDIKVSNVSLDHEGSSLLVNMSLNLADAGIAGKEALLLTPQLINGTDTLNLQPFAIYSRNRYIHYSRTESFLAPESFNFKAKEAPAAYNFSQSVNWQEWMDGAQLYLNGKSYGCCQTLLADNEAGPYALWEEPRPYMPEFIYVNEAVNVPKERKIEGSAYIDFPVNKIEIYPDYRKNPVELAKIRASIDSVKNDKDVTITSVNLKGFASPEGPYDNNVRLAKGRVAAIETYIQQLYKFPAGIIHTAYEPEDWEGLKVYVEGSNLEHKEQILAIIDSDLAPDPKNTKIQKDYPAEYKFLLQEVYPGLRHTNYEIKYVVRTFTDIDEILSVYRTSPGKLSVNELFLAAQTMPEGSDEANAVFETAARLYPDNEIANLNAANSALQRDDLSLAEFYLNRAGADANALYTRGVLAYKKGDLSTAISFLESAKLAGSAPAAAMLSAIKK